jgi:hypothetical protein
MDMLLDVNSEVYPISAKGRYSCALASTLSLDGSPDDGAFNQSGQVHWFANYSRFFVIMLTTYHVQPTLLDRYEYGMYGKLFKLVENGLDESGNPKM